MLVSTLPDHCLFHEIRQMLVSVLPGFLKLVKIRHESLPRKPAGKVCQVSQQGSRTRAQELRAYLPQKTSCMAYSFGAIISE